MRRTLIASTAASFALLATPALAVNDHASDKGKANGGHTEHAAPTTAPEQAKAYGKYCQKESKKHVKGEKGTAFSRCVTAMAKAAKDETSPTPRQAAKKACKTLSKKHVKGEKGTPYSRCIVAAAQMKKAQEQQAPTQSGS